MVLHLISDVWFKVQDYRVHLCNCCLTDSPNNWLRLTRWPANSLIAVWRRPKGFGSFPSRHNSLGTRVWNHRSRWGLRLEVPQVHYMRDTDSGACFVLLILFLAREKIGWGPLSALAHLWRIAVVEVLGVRLIVPSADVPLDQVPTWLTASCCTEMSPH